VKTILVSVDVLRGLLNDIFVALGCDKHNAECIVKGVIEADLRGHRIQGTDHIYSIVNDLKAGRLNGKARPRVIRETGATALVDGDGGAGYVGGHFAVDVAVDKARAEGIASVGLVRAGDIFMVGAYVERIARASLVGIAFTNTTPVRVHAAGGIDPVLGTNPIGFACPMPDADPIIVDLATSASAVGHIRIASYDGSPIAPGIAIDKDGNQTTDAASALAGALTPLGGHKGFGLALAGAILSGSMIGALLGGELKQQTTQSGKIPERGHLFIAIDPSAYGDAETFLHRTRRYVDEIKASRKAVGIEEILMPGERSMHQRAKSLSNGIEMLSDVWTHTIEIAQSLGLQPPAPH
jgi:L-2-hydroxycarboxylate dehydrogenase (NAD+)